MFYETSRTQAAEITQPRAAATEWDRLMLRAASALRMRHAAERTIRSLPGLMGVHSAFFVLGDLDL